MAMLEIKSLVRTASPAGGALSFLFHSGSLCPQQVSLEEKTLIRICLQLFKFMKTTPQTHYSDPPAA